MASEAEERWKRLAALGVRSESPTPEGEARMSAVILQLVYYHEDRRCELFSLDQDLGEQTNLADKQPDVRDRLAAELRRYLAAIEAQMPIVKSTGEAVPYPDTCERRGGGN